jgi:hypothetical protein
VILLGLAINTLGTIRFPGQFLRFRPARIGVTKRAIPDCLIAQRLCGPPSLSRD